MQSRHLTKPAEHIFQTAGGMTSMAIECDLALAMYGGSFALRLPFGARMFSQDTMTAPPATSKMMPVTEDAWSDAR
jgi:hypothetical protein